MENKKTITFIRFPYSSRYGGEELHTIKLAEFFSTQDYQVRLISNCPVLIKLFKEKNLKVYEFEAPKPPVSKSSLFKFTLSIPFFYCKFRNQFPADFFKNEAATFLLNLGEKIVLPKFLSKHSKKVIFLEHATIGKWLLKNPFLLVIRNHLKIENTKVISVSKKMIKPIFEAYKTKPKIIRNGIYLEDYQKVTKKEYTSLKKIGFLGRFTHEKGSNEIMKLAKEFPEIDFLISDNYEGCDLKNLKFLGFLDHQSKSKFFKEIDLLILPTVKIDPFGLVVLEAQNHYIPVLMSDKTGASDYFENNKNAFICKSNKCNLKIQEIIKTPNLLNKVSSNAAIKINTFSSKLMHEEFLKFIEN